MTFKGLLARFPDEATCKRYLVSRRWPNGVVCPKCGNTKVWYTTHRPFHWVCKVCNKNGRRFSVISGTIFENTKLPLRDWFKVIFLLPRWNMFQIYRMLEFPSYGTTWYVCYRLRRALGNTMMLETNADFDQIVTMILR